MNDALRKAATSDPEWARREARRRMILFVLAVGVLVAVGVGIPALFIGLHNGTEIVEIQHTACKVDPAGQECQTTKAESDEAASLHTSCIQFRKVDLEGKLLAETRCKGGDLASGPIIGSERRPSGHEGTGTSPTISATATKGGDATSSPSTGHSQPGRHDGGSSGHGEAGHPSNPGKPKVPTEHGGGSEGVSTPPSSSSSSESSTSSSTSATERTTETVVEAAPPEAVPPVTKGLGEVLGGVGHVVTEPGATLEEVGHGADETGHGVTCGLTGALGAPCE